MVVGDIFVVLDSLPISVVVRLAPTVWKVAGSSGAYNVAFSDEPHLCRGKRPA